MSSNDIIPGASFPLGATVISGGVNFSVFSRNATSVELLLFECEADAPVRLISLSRHMYCTSHYWHIFVPGIRPGQIYGYRVEGPSEKHKGYGFDSTKVLLDPYGLAVVVPRDYSRLMASRPGDNIAGAMKSVVVDPELYQWEGDTPLRRPFSKTIIYEMHVGGFTRHESSGVAPSKRGTYTGLIEKIPYLKDLGITAVELLPIFQFDEQDGPPGLANYWGYSPVSFFAPHAAYSSRKDPLGPLDEFRDLVKALHRAGIEILLDVVYNHTAEGGQDGPTLCFKGFANDVYYIMDEDRMHYADFAGTGNTLNANQPIVRRMILDSLHYWVEQMHVDGFRFDLASILSRDESGRPMENPPVIWDIDSDPVLAGIKLIAEAWDAAGLYQVGSFVGDNWKEWNGKFRDDVRSFFRGDEGSVSRIATRMLGSPDIFAHQEREPELSVNFVTCHDGFTLNDLVSYDHKHNEANDEDNRDGTDENLSWNCGVDGLTMDAEIQELRNRQAKNFLTVTLLSLGTPMLLMGDEFLRTQNGNNNAYCQDNEISWLDWRLLDIHDDILRFTKQLIVSRLRRDSVVPAENLSLNQILQHAHFQWHGVRLGQPDWSTHSHSLAVSTSSRDEALSFYMMMNAYWEGLEFELPPAGIDGSLHWHLWIDTFRQTPHDICSWVDAPLVDSSIYSVQPRSIVVLMTVLNREACKKP